MHFYYMAMNSSSEPGPAADNVFRLTMPPQATREWVEQNPVPADAVNRDIIIDCGATTRIDSAGIAFIAVLRRRADAAGRRVEVVNASQAVHEAVAHCARPIPDVRHGDVKHHEKEGYFARLGGTAVAFSQELTQALSVLTEMIYWSSIGLFRRRDIRRGALGEQMYQLGFRAAGIVGLLAFLIGIVLALQTAIQLRQFGADIFLAPMIGISMIRELGPLMTAIILAGRTGSATTAEIATMGVQEELDALRTMSINPVQFVVVPKFWAISLTMPMLSILSVGMGILGGFFVAVLYLGTSPGLFWGELAKNVFLRDFFAGFIKSIIFSWLIIWIGTFYGLKVRGGAEEVAQETTNSVVAGIFAIIMADAAFSFILP